MTNDREVWIAKRAYELWEQAGQPEGQSEEHWAQASAEWDSEILSSPSSQSAWEEDEE